MKEGGDKTGILHQKERREKDDDLWFFFCSILGHKTAQSQ